MNPLTTPIKSEARKTAEIILESMPRVRDLIFSQWANLVNMLWGSSDPQAVCDEIVALGVRCDLVFQESSKLAEYLAGVAQRSGDQNFAERIQSVLDQIPAVTFDENGRCMIALDQTAPSENLD